MATITTSDELRLANRSRILRSLRQLTPQSRKQIGEDTGLSAATVSQVTGDLLTEKLILEVSPGEAIKARPGRPQVQLELDPKAATIAVVTLWLNRIEVALFDYSGKELLRLRENVLMRSISKTVLRNRLFKVIDAALENKKHYRKSLRHIAVACQGTVTNSEGILLWSPIFSFTDCNLRQFLESRYGVFISVENDCNMIAKALHWRHRDKLGNTFATILTSFGVGLGFYHRGEILTGSHSSATEFGHMLLSLDGALCRCGRKGCIEAYAANYAILRRASGQSVSSEPVQDLSASAFTELVDHAIAEQNLARDAFAQAGSAIGHGLANLFAIFDPCPVVLVGPDSRAFDLMEQPMREAMNRFDDSGDSAQLSFYRDATELDLIRLGTSIHALGHLDLAVFGFGSAYDEYGDVV